MRLEIKAPEILKPTITVFGVGGAGGNAVGNMIQANLAGARFVIANTDAQALKYSTCTNKIQLGISLTKGLGAGASPDIGREAAIESESEIRACLEGSNMVFITAGMGGGTGTGAAPIIAKIAKELGILTVGIVTKPFLFEGGKRMKVAEEGVVQLQKHVDTLIVIPNQNLFRIANENTTFQEAFEKADDVLCKGVCSITDLITSPGLVNLDFADIKTVMSEKGKAMMGTGEASGDERAIKAAEAAIANPLLDQSSMFGASGVLINITGGKDMTLYEVDTAANRIREEIGDADTNIIFGSTFNPDLEGIIRVSVVATGIEPGRDLDYTPDEAAVKKNNDYSDVLPETKLVVNNVVLNEDSIQAQEKYEYAINDHITDNNADNNDKNQVPQHQHATSSSSSTSSSQAQPGINTLHNRYYGSNSGRGQEIAATTSHRTPVRTKPSLLRRVWNSLKSDQEDVINRSDEDASHSSMSKKSKVIEMPHFLKKD